MKLNFGVFILIIGALVVAAAAVGWLLIGDIGTCLGTSNATTQTLTVGADINYNPADVLGSRWYISNPDYTITENKCVLFGQAMIFDTGDISVKTELLDDHSTVVETQQKSIGTFSAVTGGSAHVSRTFKPVPAGKYTVRWTVFEGNIVRKDYTQQLITVTDSGSGQGGGHPG